jgi:predicted HicB family RNase H-like nuclease
VVRIDPAVHRELMRLAARADKSLNTVLREAIERHHMSDSLANPAIDRA